MLFAGVTAFVVASQRSSERLSEAELRKKFRCDRVTTNVLATDIYCENPEYYYEDVKNGTVIKASDYDHPRYKARHDEKGVAASTYGYNPNYADAIQNKNPDFCSDIAYALQSGPTDTIHKLHGEQAKATCRKQAEAGMFGCECDADAVLNAMRVKE